MSADKLFYSDVMFADADGNSIVFDSDTNFFKNWNDYSITVETLKGPITIKWNNVQALAANWFMQTGTLTRSRSLQSFFDFFPKWVSFNWWQNSQRNIYNLPPNPKIIDIGAGNSVTDLLLQKYIPGSEFYLVDRNSFISPTSKAQTPTKENPCWQHSWNIVEDAIKASNLDRSKFHFLDISDDWNVEADMITSYMAWCMHFPKEVYWSRVLKSLKIGGRLVLDVNIGWEKEVIEKISDELNCKHTIITSIPIRKCSISEVDKNQPNRDQLDIAAYRCSWIRYK
jgi:hypothetical protein